MYISDKDALQYAARIILILVPFFSSLFDTWSWIIEILLLLAVFFHYRGFGFRWTVIMLFGGYLASFIPVATSGILQIGFAPWAGIILLGLKERGWSTAHSMFWGLVAAAFLSALPVAPVVSKMLQPANIENNINLVIQYYDQQGMLQIFAEQGITTDDFESSLKLVMPIYYKLLPALAGIIGMFGLGVTYLTYRFFTRKDQKSKPFALLSYPWYAVWFTIIGLVAYLGGGYLKINFLEITGLNIMVMMSALSLILGLSCMAYLFRHPKMPRIAIWVIIIGAVLFPYFIFIGLAFVGLFDPVLNLRRIPDKAEGGKQ